MTDRCRNSGVDVGAPPALAEPEVLGQVDDHGADEGTQLSRSSPTSSISRIDVAPISLS